MSSGYPCPNPVCSHVFSLESVSGVAALKCPQCGNLFHFRPSKGRPRAAAPAPAPAPQEASDAAAIVFAPPADSSLMALRQAKPRSRGQWTRAIVLTLLFVLSAWLLFSFFTYLRKHGDGRQAAGAVLEFEQSNFRFRPPGSSWERDDS